MRAFLSVVCAGAVAIAAVSGGAPRAFAEGTAYEREQLALMLRQLESIESLAKRSQSALPAAQASRYRFDYAQLQADIERVRQGITAFLSPERSQPRVPADLTEVSAAYRKDSRAAEGDGYGHE